MSSYPLLFGTPYENGAGTMPVARAVVEERSSSTSTARVLLGDRPLQFDLELLVNGQPDFNNCLFPLDPALDGASFIFYLGINQVHALKAVVQWRLDSLLPYQMPWGRYVQIRDVEDANRLRAEILQAISELGIFSDEDHWTYTFGFCLVTIAPKSDLAWMVYVLTSEASKRDLALRQAAEAVDVSVDEMIRRILASRETKVMPTKELIRTALQDLETSLGYAPT